MDNLDGIMYYYFPEPPYLLIVFGFFISVTSGLAFEATLKQKVKSLFKSATDQTLKELQTLDLQVTFLGICTGVCLFLAAGLEIFSISPLFSYLVSLALTILIGGLIWSQLGKLLLQLQQGGSRSIDLDVFD